MKLVEQIDTTLGELTIHGPERRLEALKDINRQNEALIKTIVEFAKEEGLPGIAEKIAYHGTSLILDAVLIDKVATSLNKFTKIANNSMREFVQKVANTATKAPELEAITTEGIAIKVPQAADIFVLSEAQEGLKQGGKISGAIAPIIEQAEINTVKIAETTIPTVLEDLKLHDKIFAELAKRSNQIWNKIKPTQEFWNPHSLIPKSFTFEIEGQKFWVHGNGSKHLMEYTSPCEFLRNDKLASTFITPAKQTILSHELILNDFYEAVKLVIKTDDIYNTRGLLFNGWEIGIEKSRKIGGLPSIIHARKIY